MMNTADSCSSDDEELFRQVRRAPATDENYVPAKEKTIPLDTVDCIFGIVVTAIKRLLLTCFFFFQKQNLSSSSSSSTANSVFACRECGLRLSSAAWLDIHEREEHSPFFDGKFVCLVPGCTKSFKNDKKRYYHLTKGHQFPAEFRFLKRPPPSSKNRRQPRVKAAPIDKKRILCRYIKGGELCPHGQQCWFAHDKADIIPDQISFGRRRPQPIVRDDDNGAVEEMDVGE